MSFTASALVVSWVAIALLAFALVGVLARVHRLESALASTATPTPAGRSLDLPGVEDGPVLALFADKGCGSCERAAAEVADLVDEGRAVVLWRDEEPEPFAALEVPLSPYAVVADHELRIVAAHGVGGPDRLAEAKATLSSLEASAVA